MGGAPLTATDAPPRSLPQLPGEVPGGEQHLPHMQDRHPPEPPPAVHRVSTSGRGALPKGGSCLQEACRARSAPILSLWLHRALGEGEGSGSRKYRGCRVLEAGSVVCVDACVYVWSTCSHQHECPDMRGAPCAGPGQGRLRNPLWSGTAQDCLTPAGLEKPSWRGALVAKGSCLCPSLSVHQHLASTL